MLLAEAHVQAPFFLGYNLTTYTAGKYHATRMHSGRVRIRSSIGTSPIHISFANNKGGVLSCCSMDEQEAQTVASECPWASVCKQDHSDEGACLQ